MDQNAENLSLHFKYCGFIAVMTVVAIATEKWSASKDFTAYLSNAATMTSLLLGVVAIFYSFISNDGMSRSLGSITTVSTEIRDIRGDIEQFSKLTQNATTESEHNTVLVREASANLSESLNGLSITLRQISEQNEALKGLVSVLPTRMEQLETKFGDVAKAVGEKPQSSQSMETSEEVSPAIVERFLGRASLDQNLLSYACVLAASSKKELSILHFCKAVEVNAPTTYNSFLTCMHAVQLCLRKRVEGQEKVYTVDRINPTLVTRNRPYFVSYVEKNYAAKPEEKISWLKKLAAVEALFA
ncbi:MAG TPA: hypothetical protein VJ752_19590 [Burkholderiaceae bacterium]|nr:hypothetical protein [Burkholderiaceae bacterium]